MAKRKVYRSQLTTAQKEQYDILKKRGIDVSPFAIKKISQQIRKANKLVKKTEGTLAEMATLTQRYAKFIHNEDEYRKFLKRISQRIRISEEQITSVSNYNREKLIAKVNDVVGSDLGLSKLTNTQIARLLKDPAYRRFKAFMYGDTDPKSSQDAIDKNIEMFEDWANAKGDLQSVIKDIASYSKGK